MFVISRRLEVWQSKNQEQRMSEKGLSEKMVQHDANSGAESAVSAPTLDPRDPDYGREGIFVYHNCWKCSDGAKPCVRGRPSNCEYPHARNGWTASRNAPADARSPNEAAG
jgi:hypothetical protein